MFEEKTTVAKIKIRQNKVEAIDGYFNWGNSAGYEFFDVDPQVITTCEEFDIDSTTIALNGGEDYELLITISQEDFPKIKANPNLTVIGYITNKNNGMHLVTRAEEKIPLKAQGWNSLS